MTTYTVTKLSNVDKEGNLKDQNLIGFAVSDHMQILSQTSPDGKALLSGPLFRICVLWEHDKRVSYEAPEDLLWLDLDPLSMEDDDEDDDVLEDDDVN